MLGVIIFLIVQQAKTLGKKFLSIAGCSTDTQNLLLLIMFLIWANNRLYFSNEP